MPDPMRLLLVDDEPLALRRLEAVLHDMEDIEIVGTAGDGDAALNEARRLLPDLVILDVEMPGRNGLSAAADLERDSDAEIVILSAFDRYATSAFDVQALDYLLKPLRPDRLRQPLQRARLTAYLDVEAVRFGDRLAVEYACDEGLSMIPVPNFSLQPLVENAVKHAVALSDRVLVSIRAGVLDGRLVITVEDNGAPQTLPVDGGGGMGLRNVATRLASIYGPGAGLHAARVPGGYRATVTIPLPAWMASANDRGKGRAPAIGVPGRWRRRCTTPPRARFPASSIGSVSGNRIRARGLRSAKGATAIDWPPPESGRLLREGRDEPAEASARARG